MTQDVIKIKEKAKYQFELRLPREGYKYILETYASDFTRVGVLIHEIDKKEEICMCVP
jgi:hypothetical protein